MRTWTCGCQAERGPQDADRADIWLMVEQYRERLAGSTETPANDGTGRGPSGAAGSTFGTWMACATPPHMSGLSRVTDG